MRLLERGLYAAPLRRNTEPARRPRRRRCRPHGDPAGTIPGAAGKPIRCARACAPRIVERAGCPGATMPGGGGRPCALPRHPEAASVSARASANPRRSGGLVDLRALEMPLQTPVEDSDSRSQCRSSGGGEAPQHLAAGASTGDRRQHRACWRRAHSLHNRPGDHRNPAQPVPPVAVTQPGLAGRGRARAAAPPNAPSSKMSTVWYRGCLKSDFRPAPAKALTSLRHGHGPHSSTSTASSGKWPMPRPELRRPRQAIRREDYSPFSSGWLVPWKSACSTTLSTLGIELHGESSRRAYRVQCAGCQGAVASSVIRPRRRMGPVPLEVNKVDGHGGQFVKPRRRRPDDPAAMTGDTHPIEVTTMRIAPRPTPS